MLTVFPTFCCVRSIAGSKLYDQHVSKPILGDFAESVSLLVVNIQHLFPFSHTHGLHAHTHTRSPNVPLAS